MKTTNNITHEEISKRAHEIWEATGRETWACLGISNIGRAPVPDGAPVVIARDGDEPGSKADRQIVEALDCWQPRLFEEP